MNFSMAAPVFVDTGYFYARLSPRDQWHEKARKVRIEAGSAVTSSLVVNETISLLQLRGFYSAALAYLERIRTSDDIKVIPVERALQEAAWDLFARHGGSGATIVDCASFAIMRSQGIRRALTFDVHFSEAGFEILG